MSSKERKQPELPPYLEKMTAGQIYLAAHKKHVLHGLSLCRQATIGDVCWSEDGSLLNVEVLGNGWHEVSIGLDGRNLKSACDCANWTPQSQCPHVVCVLALLKKAVSPDSLTSLEFSDKSLREIRVALRGRQRSTQASPSGVSTSPRSSRKPRFRLVVEKKDDSLAIAVTSNGTQVSPFSQGMTHTTSAFLRKLSSHREDADLFEEFFRCFGRTSQVVLRDGTTDFPLVVERKTRHVLQTRLNLTGGKVEVTRSLADGKPLGRSVYVTRHHIFDLEERKVWGIESDAGRYFRNRVNELFLAAQGTGGAAAQRDSGAVGMELAFFNRAMFPVAELEKESLHLCVEGKEVPPADFRPCYRLRAENHPADGEKIDIRAEGYCDETYFTMSPVFSRIFAAPGLEKLSPPLRTKRRVALLYEVCFKSLGCADRKDLVKMMRVRLNNGDFTRRAPRQAFKEIVESFVDGTAQRELRLLALKDGWATARIDKGIESKLLEIPWAMFGPEIFSAAEKAGEMTVPRSEFLHSLPELHRRLAEHGIGLFFEDKPVTPVRWDFSVDAARSSLDWFEIRPEIRCDGALVDEEELARALKNGGLLVGGSAVGFLDEESGRTFAVFAELTGKRNGETVRIPRLRILDWLALRRKGVEVKLPPEDERIMESLFSFEKVPPIPLPAGLKTDLRRYQAEGYSWLGFLYEHRFGACLADDMGLGKTVQAISLLAGLKEGNIRGRYGAGTPHLVVVPPSLIFNWENELARFYPDIRVTVYRGPRRSTDFAGFDVVLTSFDIVRRDIAKLEDVFFHVMIFDEAQSVKNIQAETTSAVRRLRGDFRLALTGTPVENHLGEYNTIMELAVPGLLGTSGAAGRKRGNVGDSRAEIDTVVRRSRPFVLRRSKEMIAAELPAKVETDIYLDLTPRQKALYTRTVGEVRKTVDDAYRDRSPGQARIIALAAILRLRQICLSPRLFLPESKENSPKTDFLVEQLEELTDEGHSVLVFSQFTSFLDIVQEETASRGMRFFRLDGSTPVGERKKLVTAFQNGGEPSVFLLSLKAGGRGLNLTRASYVFHLDPWWNPAVENQASDRAHRIGQTSKVNIIRLLMRHTVEEKMMALKQKKLRLYKALLEDAETGGMSIGREDFHFLLEG